MNSPLRGSPFDVWYAPAMDLVAFTRQLVDVESITGNEGSVGNLLFHELETLGFQAEQIPVEAQRCNIYATSAGHPHPEIVLSTHMDTVPPFIASSEDESRIYGRGSCDAKGIIAAQVAAAVKLRAEGIYVGLLFLVGEERDGLGAKVVNLSGLGCKCLVKCDPSYDRGGVALKDV